MSPTTIGIGDPSGHGEHKRSLHKTRVAHTEIPSMFSEGHIKETALLIETRKTLFPRRR